jgi:NAD(P)H-nitrite reductase large subunit
MTEHYDFVIIGNSAAGLQAIRTLRRHDRQSTIALIDREDCPAYSRVLTPYYIGGHIPRERLQIVGHDFYRELGVKTLFGHSVVAIDPEKHSVQRADGRDVDFGKLLLATGAEARTLTVSAHKSCVLRHMADAEKIVGLLKGVQCITAIGAGLVSLPLLSHAHARIEKHLIVGSDRIFSRVIDAEASWLLEEMLIKQGLTLHKQDDIREIREEARLRMMLNSGTVLTSDLLIVGKGVTPNTRLAVEAGLDVGNGIRIDRFCRSNHPDVFAAGDAAEGADFISGEATIQGNWMTAVEQGENAALNMLGLECPYPGSLKNNITEIFGIDVAAVGYCQDDVSQTVYSWNALTGRFRKVFLDERQRVVGATLIGDTNDAGLYYHLASTRGIFPGKKLLNGTANYAQVQQRLAS